MVASTFSLHLYICIYLIFVFFYVFFVVFLMAGFFFFFTSYLLLIWLFFIFLFSILGLFASNFSMFNPFQVTISPGFLFSCSRSSTYHIQYTHPSPGSPSHKRINSVDAVFQRLELWLQSEAAIAFSDAYNTRPWPQGTYPARPLCVLQNQNIAH